jgi:hypothetical protein
VEKYGGDFLKFIAEFCEKSSVLPSLSEKEEVASESEQAGSETASQSRRGGGGEEACSSNEPAQQPEPAWDFFAAPGTPGWQAQLKYLVESREDAMSKARVGLSPSVAETYVVYVFSGTPQTIESVAAARKLAASTVVRHLSDAIQNGFLLVLAPGDLSRPRFVHRL